MKYWRWSTITPVRESQGFLVYKVAFPMRILFILVRECREFCERFVDFLQTRAQLQRLTCIPDDRASTAAATCLLTRSADTQARNNQSPPYPQDSFSKTGDGRLARPAPPTAWQDSWKAGGGSGGGGGGDGVPTAVAAGAADPGMSVSASPVVDGKEESEVADVKTSQEVDTRNALSHMLEEDPSERR